MTHASNFTSFVPGIPGAQGGTVPIYKAKVGKNIQVTMGTKGLGKWRIACRNAFAWQAKLCGISEPWDCAIGFSATFWFPSPKANLRKDGTPKERYAVTKFDMDKTIRAIWDSLTKAGVIVDDKRICGILNTWKLVCNAGQQPGVEVTVWKLRSLQPGELPISGPYSNQTGGDLHNAQEEALREVPRAEQKGSGEEDGEASSEEVK